jgi:hypothetical protein
MVTFSALFPKLLALDSSFHVTPNTSLKDGIPRLQGLHPVSHLLARLCPFRGVG